MLQQVLMALGAGAASALLFVLPAKQSMFAMALGIVAPLPLMIAAIGLGERFGAIAVLVGALALAAGVDPVAGGTFLVSAGVPALALSFMARRPGLGDPGNLVWACAGLATVLSWLGLAVVASQYASLDAAVDDLATQLSPVAVSMLEAAKVDLEGVDVHRFTTWVVLALTPMAAFWSLAGLVANLWLAARVVDISGLLGRPWPDLPSTLRLPKPAFAILGLALAACLAPGLARVLAATAVAAMVTAFGLQGLARIHLASRGWAARLPMLFGLYAVSIFLFPWPLVLAAGLGLADAAGGLRSAAADPPPPHA